MNRALTTILFALLGILVIVLIMGAVLLVRDNDSAASEPVATEAVVEDAAAEEVAVVEPSATAATNNSAALPAPGITVFPTETPPPTAVPTDTPVPTETPVPTAIPTNTSIPPTPVPVVIPPTNTPLPPTDVPPPPGPQAGTHNGVRATWFALQPRSNFGANQLIWFEFSIVNDAGGPIPFGALGVMPRRDGGDLVQWVQVSWGGNDDTIPASGLNWEDNIKIPEGGNYTLRLVICFDDTNACKNGSGTWFTLSESIPITVN